MDRPPAIDAALLQSMERFLPEGVVGAAAFPDELFGLLAHLSLIHISEPTRP